MPPWAQFLVVSLSLLSTAVAAVVEASPLPPFYHSTTDIMSSLKSLLSVCPGMTIGQEHLHGTVMTVVRLEAVGKHQGKSARESLLVFGEHARELISSEIALQFIRKVCEVRSGRASAEEPFAE
ncbi:hypothetical protein FOZ63_013016, partial [Perkinsus olseni]